MKVGVVLAVVSFVVLGGLTANAQERNGGLQALIDATASGDTLLLGPGTYEGGVVIDHPMTIDGGGAAVIDGRSVGTIITVEAADVTIRNLTIVASGQSLDHEDAAISVNAERVVVEGNTFKDVLFGVYLRESTDSVVRNNVIGAKDDLALPRRGDAIRLWESDRSVVEGNIALGGRDVVLWYSDDILIRNNHISNGRYGLHFMYSDDAVIVGNILADNSVGAFLMYSHRLTITDNVLSGNGGPSGYGLGLKDIDGVEARDNRFVGNRIGVYLDNSPSSVGIEHHFVNNLFAYNDTGVTLLPSVSGNVFSENSFVDNRLQVGVNGGGVLRENTWVLDGVGNHWSDFAGYDANGDGIGDMEYRIDDLFGEMTIRHPELVLFAGSPAAHVVDAAAASFPSLRPAPRVIDPAPLVRRIEFAGPSPVEPGRAEMAMLAAILLVPAGLLMTVGRRRTVTR